MKNNNKIYLIAIDMDGTLLNSSHVLSLKTKNYLKKLSKLGHKIIISSGRPIRGIMPFYNELELETPAICYNGAYIYPGKESNYPEYCFAFPKDEILKIIEEIGYDCLDNIILETNNDIYLLKNDDALDIFFSKDNMKVHLGDIKDNLNEDTMTMLIKVKDDKYNPHIQEVIDKHQKIKLRFWSGKWCEISEIYFDDINKGKALKNIANYFNISPENIIAFGDASNDIEMIEYAGYGVAMKNAEDELKSAAKYISEFDNDNDGIYHFLKNIFEK